MPVSVRCSMRSTSSSVMVIALLVVAEVAARHGGHVGLGVADHAPIECGCFWAYPLTEAGARRSEFPAEDGVHRAARHPVEAGPDVPLHPSWSGRRGSRAGRTPGSCRHSATAP